MGTSISKKVSPSLPIRPSSTREWFVGVGTQQRCNTLIDGFLSSQKITFDALGVKINSYDLVCLVYQLYASWSDATCSSHFFIALYTALGSLYHKSYSEMMKVFSTHVVTLFSMCFFRLTDGAAVVQSGDLPEFDSFLDSVRECCSHYNDVVESEFGAKLCTFVSLLLCLPFAKQHKIGTKWLGFSHMQVKAMEKANNNKHSMTWFVNLLDCSQFVIRKMVAACYHKGDINQIIFGDTEMRSYSEKFQLLMHYADKLELVSNQGWTYKDYLIEVDELMKVNQQLTRCAANKTIAGGLKHDYSLLQRCRFRVSDKLQVTRERDPPWAFLLIAPPGVGKSAIMEKLFKVYCDIAKSVGRSKFDYDPAHKYTHNFYSEYMSEFKMSTRFIVMDDIDQYKANILEQMKGGPASQAIAWINPTPHVTNQAELHNKGMIPCLVDIVAGTANTHEAGLSDIFRKEGGIFRRFLFLEVEVREEFRKPGETLLAGDKENPLNPELHWFYPRKYENINGANNQKYWHKSTQTWEITRGEPMSFSDLAFFLRERILIPFFNQTDIAKASTNHFLSSPLCETCGITSAICKCGSVQSGDSFDSFDMPVISDDDTLCSEDSLYQHFDEESSWRDFLCFTGCLFWISVFTPLEFVCRKLDWTSWAAVFSGYMFSYSSWTHRYSDEHGSFWRRFRHKVHGYVDSVFNITEKSHFSLDAFYSHQETMQKAFKVTQLIAFISLMATVAHYFTKSKDKTATQAGEVPKHGAAKNVWKTRYEDMTRMTGAPSTTTMEQLRNVVSNNIIQLAVPNGKMINYVCGLGLYGDVCAVPKHFLAQIKHLLPVKVNIIRSDTDDTCGPNRYGVTIDESCFHSTNTWEDMVLFKHPAVGPLRDVRKFLLKRHFHGTAKGVFLYRDQKGVLQENAHQGFRLGNLSYRDPKMGTSFSCLGYKSVLDYRTEVGQCGGPYLVHTLNGVCIGGFHVAAVISGETNTGYCFPLLASYDYSVDALVPHSYNGIDLNETFVTKEDLAITQSLHPKCPSRLLDKGAMCVYGKLGLFRRKLKSEVVPTLMAEQVLQHYGKLDFTHFSPKDINSRIAAKQNLENMVSKPDFLPSLVNDVENHMVALFSGVIKELGIQVPKASYPLDVGINGLDGVAYVDRLAVKTSGGFAHRGRKDKYFVELSSTDEHDLRYGLNEEITAEVRILRERALRGERMGIVWDMNFKDEPISESKVLKDKCRIFNSAPLAFSVLMRCHFLWCVPLFLGKFRHHFGMATGANAVGDDWTTLYHHVVKFGKNRIIAGDYSSFDKRMPANLLMSAFNVLIRIAKKAGFPESDLTMMRAIATETSYPLTNVFGSVVGFYGSNPSGHPLTTIINCIVNIMYMMIAVKEIERDTGKSEVDYDNFFDSFSLLTYGDDNIGSSRLDYINHTAISDALAHFGVPYTMADKESKSRPFISIEEADFLKRRFIMGTYKPGVVQAPLSEASILKSLSICTRSRSIMFEQQCAEILDSACREYFQYGKKKFLEKRRFLASLAQRYNLEPYMAGRGLPTFEELYEDRFGATVQSGYVTDGNYYSLLGYGTSSGDDSDKENSDTSNWDYMPEVGYLSCGCIVIADMTIHRELSCHVCHCDQLVGDAFLCGGLLCVNVEHNDNTLNFDTL